MEQMKIRSRDAHIALAGASALRVVAEDVRTLVAGREPSDALWHTIRNLEGLAARLADWRRGRSGGFVGGQDLAVLEQLLDEVLEDGQRGRISISTSQRAALAELRELLESSM